MKKKVLFLIIIILLAFIVLYKAILPSSFGMEIHGDFNDSTIITGYTTTPPGSVIILSSGGEKLEGDTYYTYSAPGTDGNLIMCQIKNKKWVTNSNAPQECTSLARLATTRTGLIKQIITGELKPIKSEECIENVLCYELK